MKYCKALKILDFFFRWLRFGYGEHMKIEIDEHACKKIQSLIAVTLSARDYEYFVDWLILIVRSFLQHEWRHLQPGKIR